MPYTITSCPAISVPPPPWRNARSRAHPYDCTTRLYVNTGTNVQKAHKQEQDAKHGHMTTLRLRQRHWLAKIHSEARVNLQCTLLFPVVVARASLLRARRSRVHVSHTPRTRLKQEANGRAVGTDTRDAESCRRGAVLWELWEDQQCSEMAGPPWRRLRGLQLLYRWCWSRGRRRVDYTTAGVDDARFGQCCRKQRAIRHSIGLPPSSFGGGQFVVDNVQPQLCVAHKLTAYWVAAISCSWRPRSVPTRQDLAVCVVKRHAGRRCV